MAQPPARPATVSALVACAVGLAVCGCATTLLSLRGDAHGEALDLHARGTLGAESTEVTVEVENHLDAPVGIDLNAVSLLDGKRVAHLALGKRSDAPGKKGAAPRRQKREPVAVEPGEKASFTVEFDKLPDGQATALVLRRLYRLSVEGQVALDETWLPLRVEAQAPDGGAKDAFFDPFVEE